MRFRIVVVEYLSRRRIPKASALWSPEVIRANGIPAEGEPRLAVSVD